MPPKPIDPHRAGLAVEKLLTARWVTHKDLAAAIGMSVKTLMAKQRCIRDELSAAEVARIGEVLEAPPWWPERTEDLPTERIAISAPPLTPEEEARREEMRPATETALARMRRIATMLERASDPSLTRDQVVQLFTDVQREAALTYELARSVAEKTQK